MIHRSAQRMDGLIQDLLDVSRVEHGRLTLNPQDEALGPLLNEAATMLRPLGENKGIRRRNAATGAGWDSECPSPAAS